MDAMRQNEMGKKLFYVYVDGDMDIYDVCRKKIEFSCSSNEWKLKKEEELWYWKIE